MATTNHVRLSNLALNDSQTIAFRGFFELTRAMKKAGWKFKASSNGTTKISSADPAADQWGAGVTLNVGATAASIATPTQGRATVTGLTNIVAADKGRFLLISAAATGANNNQHQIEEVLSATSVRIDARNFAVAADANNGTLTWSIRDPLGDTFNNSAFNMNTIAWWCAQGPSVLKIPITAASVGSFIKGENVVQSTTLAEGEVLGYTYYNATGWLVIAPRVRGSGGGVHGWATANTITGGRSGATVSQSGTALDYVWEVVFAKPANQTTIQILVGQFNTVADSAELFSFCATQAGATATVHPGGGGTGNAFGAHAWVMWGTNSTPTFGSFICADTSPQIQYKNAQVICVDAIPEQGYSADGSWAVALHGPVTSYVSTMNGHLYGLQRLNDMEDGEVSTHVSVTPPASKTLYANNRTSSGVTLSIGINQAAVFQFGYIDATASTTTVYHAGWRGRGLTTEAFTEFEIAALALTQTNVFVQGQTIIRTSRMASTANLLTKTRERIWLVSTSFPYTFVKGSFRWLYWVSGEQATDTYGVDPGWVQLGSCENLLQHGSTMVIGPYDGTPWALQPGPN
jgi:hypothetical protein